MRKIAGYLTKNRSEKDQKIAQSTHENGYIKPRKTFWRNSKQLLNSKTLIAIWESKMRKANAIKFTIYFLLFAIILYFEYYAIEMQEGEWIAHDDRRPLASMMVLIGICPIYALYDMAIRNTLCRLSALLLQAVFNLWSLLWFSSLPTLGTYEAEYERTGVLPENMIPSDENNFYFCWIVGAIIMLYLAVAMTISYVMKLYAGSKRLNHPNSD